MLCALQYEPITPAFLDKHQCQYALHGDDMPVSGGGTSMYGPVIEADRMKIFKRTLGISSTSLIQRILRLVDGEVSQDPPSPLAAVPSPFLVTAQR